MCVSVCLCLLFCGCSRHPLQFLSPPRAILTPNAHIRRMYRCSRFCFLRLFGDCRVKTSQEPSHTSGGPQARTPSAVPHPCDFAFSLLPETRVCVHICVCVCGCLFSFSPVWPPRAVRLTPQHQFHPMGTACCSARSSGSNAPMSLNHPTRHNGMDAAQHRKSADFSHASKSSGRTRSPCDRQ